MTITPIPSSTLLRHCKFYDGPIVGETPKVARCFNPSICCGAIAYRVESHDRRGGKSVSRIAIGWLYTRDPVAVLSNRVLDLYTSTGVCEDPRLFMAGSHRMLAYNDSRRMCLARLSADLEVEYSSPIEHIDAMSPVEKNWTPWYRDSDGTLDLIEHTSHMRTLRCREIFGIAHTFTVRDRELKFSHACARGGAPIVAHGGAWFHWWHRHVDVSGVRYYRIGVTKFTGTPEDPKLVWWKDNVIVADQNHEAGKHSVIFPGSAEKTGTGWRLACGRHDRECVIVDITDEELEAVQPNGHA